MAGFTCLIVMQVTMSTLALFWLKSVRYLFLVAGFILVSELHAQSPWTARSSGTTANLAGAVYASELGAASLVAVGAQGTILSSADDGVTWTRRDSGTSLDLTAVTYVSSIKRLFAVGEGGVILASADGVVWAREASPTSVRLNAIAALGDTVSAVGEAGVGLLTREASGGWTRRDVGFSDRSMRGLAGGVAVGQAGAIFSLTTGVSGVPDTWTMVPSPSGVDLEAVGLGGLSQTSGEVTVVGAGGTILKKLSTGYAARVSGTTGRLRSICFKLGGSIRIITGLVRIDVGEFFVVGSGGAILRSADGVTWQPDLSSTASNLNAVVAARNNVIAFGDAGTVLTSGASSGSMLAITRQPTIGYDQAGNPFLDGAAIGEGALTYQWVELTAGLPRPVGLGLPRISLPAPSFAGNGPPAYRLFVGNAFGIVQSETVTTNRLSNLSSRAVVGAGEKKLISGFAVASVLSTPRTILIRAVGPTLGNFGLSNVLKTPRLTVFSGQSVIATNTGWQTNADVAGIVNATNRLGAFSLSSNSADSVLLLSLAPGNYTAQVESADGSVGVALVEVYDVDPPSLTRLSNLSARAEVQTGDGILIGGLVIEGGLKKKMLLRASGPALAAFGLQNILAKPKLTLFSGGNVLSTATNWSAAGNAADLRTAAKAAGAFAFPEGSADAALLVELNPGAYTLQISGADGGTGVALIEVYEQP